MQADVRQVGRSQVLGGRIAVAGVARLPGTHLHAAPASTSARVPDVRSARFAGEAHRRSAAVASAEHDEEDQAFVDALARDGE